jgi:CRP-like cAMP-binding protein
LRQYQAGQVVANAGDEDGTVFAIVHGALALIPALGPTDAPIAHIIQPGNWVGFIPLITGAPRSGTIVAKTRATLALVSQSDFSALLKSQPEWWQHLARLAIKYGDTATNVAADLMIADSSRRCLAALLRLSGCRFATPPDKHHEALVNQAELGAIANLSRNSVSRILRKEAERGLIALQYTRIAVLQPDAIRVIVDEN